MPMIEVVRLSESTYQEMMKEKPKESAVIAMRRKPYDVSMTFAEILQQKIEERTRVSM